MTNFETITKDETELAGWLSDARIGCDMCPVETECSKDCGPIYDRCYRLILEWLERDEETEERSTCQYSRQDGLAGLHPDDVKAVKEILERARKSSPYNKGCEDGYIKALRDLADLVRTELYCPVTFYDEGVNTGLRKVIDVADYLMQKMKSEGVKNDE